MDNQEWFERFKVKISSEETLEKMVSVAEDRLHGQIWINEQWRIAQFALIKMALHMLPSLQRKVVKLIFFDDLSERKAARKLKITKTQVHRIKNKALKVLARSAFVKLAFSRRLLKGESKPSSGSPSSSCAYA